MFPSLILPDTADAFDIVLHLCQSVRPESGRDAVGEAVIVVAPAQKAGRDRQKAHSRENSCKDDKRESRGTDSGRKNGSQVICVMQ